MPQHGLVTDPVLSAEDEATAVGFRLNDDSIATELQSLRILNEEKAAVVAELTENYQQLQAKHEDTLSYVEELKNELQKTSSLGNLTGRASPSPGMIRRKAERSSYVSERGNRYFATIRNLIMENFDGDSDKAQAMENNLTSAMSEYHNRCDRIRKLLLEG